MYSSLEFLFYPTAKEYGMANENNESKCEAWRTYALAIKAEYDQSLVLNQYYDRSEFPPPEEKDKLDKLYEKSLEARKVLEGMGEI